MELRAGFGLQPMVESGTNRRGRRSGETSALRRDQRRGLAGTTPSPPPRRRGDRIVFDARRTSRHRTSCGKQFVAADLDLMFEICCRRRSLRDCRFGHELAVLVWPAAANVVSPGSSEGAGAGGSSFGTSAVWTCLDSPSTFANPPDAPGYNPGS